MRVKLLAFPLLLFLTSGILFSIGSPIRTNATDDELLFAGITWKKEIRENQFYVTESTYDNNKDKIEWDITNNRLTIREKFATQDAYVGVSTRIRAEGYRISVQIDDSYYHGNLSALTSGFRVGLFNGTSEGVLDLVEYHIFDPVYTQVVFNNSQMLTPDMDYVLMVYFSDIWEYDLNQTISFGDIRISGAQIQDNISTESNISSSTVEGGNSMVEGGNVSPLPIMILVGIFLFFLLVLNLRSRVNKTTSSYRTRYSGIVSDYVPRKSNIQLCGGCGTKNHNDNIYCIECGSYLH